MTSKLDSATGDLRRKRVYNKEFAPTMIAYGLSSWAAAAWGNLDGDSPTRFLWAALPLIPAIALVVVYVRHHRRLDDYQQLLQYKGLAMGIAGAGNSGTVIAMLAAPPLALAFGWRTVYLIGLIPMVLAMVLLQIFAKEPPDREEKNLKDYLKILVSKDAWIFNLIYSVTFGGFIGLASFLPTLFHDHYHIAKQHVGIYVTVGVIAASGLRVVGGWLADHMGGIRVLFLLFGIILFGTGVAALMPPSAITMAFVIAISMGAMGAGNGAVFQLVPLRFRGDTAVAGSLIGEVGALMGGFLPVAMGLGKKHFDSFTPGFLSGAILTVLSLVILAIITRQWTTTWVGAHGKALDSFGEERRHAVSSDIDG